MRALALALLALAGARCASAEDQLAPALSLTAAAAALAMPPDVLPGSPEGLELALRALEARGHSDAAVAAAALSALARAFDADTLASGGLSDTAPPLVTAALAADAPDVIVAAMRSHSAVAGVAGAGCAAVLALGRHAAAHGPLGNSGGVEAAVGALRAHDGDADVVTACLTALMNVVVGAENKGRVRSAGVPGAVVAAMRAHGGEIRVARQGCGTLNNAAAGHSLNKALVAEQGGIHAVLAALRTHRRDAPVVEQACAAIAVISTGDGLAKPIADAGGLVDATLALESHLGLKKPKAGSGRKERPASARVAAACARALAAVAWNDEPLKRAAREALAPELLREAAKRFPDDAQVAKWTAKALEKITDPYVEEMFAGMLGNFGPEL
jgi:hypothetical protein